MYCRFNWLLNRKTPTACKVIPIQQSASWGYQSYCLCVLIFLRMHLKRVPKSKRIKNADTSKPAHCKRVSVIAIVAYS